MSHPEFLPQAIRGRGPIPPDVLVIGDWPSQEELMSGAPFERGAAAEVRKMLSEAKISVSRCYFTYAVKHPAKFKLKGLPGFATSKTEAKEKFYTAVNGMYPSPFILQQQLALHSEIETLQPKLIITMGELALWMLTGESSPMTWRGSLSWHKGIPVVPTLNYNLLLKAYGLRYIVVQDLRRACEYVQRPPSAESDKRITIAPSYEQAMSAIQRAIAVDSPLAIDIETRARNIDCLGIGFSKHEAICIPFFKDDGGSYWAEHEEIEIVLALQQLLAKAKIIGQNFQYDTQYIVRRMLVFPNLYFDTMLAQHAMLPGEPKDLGFLSSLYSDVHVYWKEDGKERDLHVDDTKFWQYNGMDCCRTYEVYERQTSLLDRFKLRPQFNFLMELFPHVIVMMLKGIKIHTGFREQATKELEAAIAARHGLLQELIGDINIGSSDQMKDLFYGQFGCKVIKHKKTKQATMGKDALKLIGDENPILYPVTSAIEEMRSLATFNRNFAQAPLDYDGRIRCSFNIGGAETFRFSSSESAFGTGTNLQNVPKGDRLSTLAMPNMRSMFVPDPGKVICDVDLAGADAQVVAWEVDDSILKAAFRAKVKIHVVNAKDLFGGDAGPDGKREPYYTYAKVGVHATNYGAAARTVARALGIIVHEAEKFQKRWFQIHPNIPKWHQRVESDVSRTRTIYNKFGFRKVFFDRIENVRNQALAWVPQSTVAINVNTSLIQLTSLKQVELLIQVHDSLVFQIPLVGLTESLKEVNKKLQVTIPYDDPLIIDYGLAISEKSWGAVEKIEWPK